MNHHGYMLLYVLLLTGNAWSQERSPDIPLIEIMTVGKVMPSCTIVQAPEGCVGVTITDNEYVAGRMTITLHGEKLYDSGNYVKSTSGMRIKRRGNSTGAYLAQHPYKLKLSKKADLLGRKEEKFMHKDWLLLSMYTWNPTMSNKECNILNMAGTTVSKIVGMEWTPEYEFVNVVLNGEYQGMYYLMEAVQKGDSRVNISNEGFLIEDDNFWWNEDVYFKTSHQTTWSGYTFKYPDSDDVSSDDMATMATYMENVEDAVYGGKDVSTTIDLESFAKWMLVHDILGTDDGAGANRFLYRYDMTANALLKIGPVWDYDSSFRTTKGWSELHNYNRFYYPSLFKNPTFVEISLTLYKQIRPSFLEKVHDAFDTMTAKYANSFDENMKAHRTVFPYEGLQPFKEQMAEVEQKLQDRILVLDNLMEQLETTTDVIMPATTSEMTSIIDLSGNVYPPTEYDRLPKGIYILTFSNGTNKKIIK